MHILVNTHHDVEGGPRPPEHYQDVIGQALAHVSERVMRAELYLRDDNGSKAGSDDKRCSIEVRLNGMKPLAVSAQGQTMDQAVERAAEKARHLVENTLGRLRTH